MNTYKRLHMLSPLSLTRIMSDRIFQSCPGMFNVAVPMVCPQQTWLRCQQQRSMAGHNKWSNIRHIKASKDYEKMQTTHLIIQRIKAAIREGGEADPKFNPQLAHIINIGMKQNVLKSSMLNAIKNFEKTRTTGNLIYIHARGPHNSALIVEAFTTRSKFTRNMVASVLRRNGGQILGNDGASHLFAFKGLIFARPPDGSKIDMDAVEEVAIEVGAEEVEEITDDDDDLPALKFVSDQKDLHSVKSALLEHKYEIQQAGLVYLPTVFATLTIEQAELLKKVLDKIENLEDVDRVYDNVEVQ